MRDGCQRRSLSCSILREPKNVTRSNRKTYRGRFAPSPTGPLHFGSLVAAVGSYLQAKSHLGEWIVRIEDLDMPRNVPGAADDILRALQAFGFEWDGEVVYQSERQNLYAAALEELTERGATFPCACSRKEIADSSLVGIDGPIYPGTCRAGLAAEKIARTIRLRVADACIEFTDSIQGHCAQDLGTEIGDFVLRRADGIFAYQLAVVVDDAEQGITEIIRGADLLASAPRQIFLQRILRYETPRYGHLPIAVNPAREKLSKQTLAKPIDAKKATEELFDALKFLGQSPLYSLRQSSQKALWDWALAHWSLENIPSKRTIRYDSLT